MKRQSGTFDNKAVVRRFVEDVINRGDDRLLRELVSPKYVIHCPEGDLYGPDGARLDLMELRAAFPDLRLELTELLAEGDLVARRFTLHGTHSGPFLGLCPSGRQVAIPALGLDRVRDGRLVETWIAFNVLPPVQLPDARRGGDDDGAMTPSSGIAAPPRLVGVVRSPANQERSTR
jgi:predicted ester cyclase